MATETALAERSSSVIETAPDSERAPQYATVKAFLTSVSFVSPKSRGTSVARAYLHLEDDADCHKYKIAVPSEFARALAKKIEDDGFEDEPSVVLLVTSILLGTDEGAPSLAQLTALGPRARSSTTRRRVRSATRSCHVSLTASLPLPARTRPVPARPCVARAPMLR